MDKYENIGINANRDKFWLGVDDSYRNLKYLALSMAVAAVIMANFDSIIYFFTQF